MATSSGTSSDKGPGSTRSPDRPAPPGAKVTQPCGCDGSPAAVIGPTRSGHGVVFVEQLEAHRWVASWCDLGSVSFEGGHDAVMAWAWAQPAAEHLHVVPGAEEVSLPRLSIRTRA